MARWRSVESICGRGAEAACRNGNEARRPGRRCGDNPIRQIVRVDETAICKTSRGDVVGQGCKSREPIGVQVETGAGTGGGGERGGAR